MLDILGILLISTGQVSDSIRHLTILQSPVFLINSRLPHFSYTHWVCQRVMFLPKLHIQFAEFLQHSYLKHLSILYLVTSVGLRYGQSSELFLAVRSAQGSKPVVPLGIITGHSELAYEY